MDPDVLAEDLTQKLVLSSEGAPLVYDLNTISSAVKFDTIYSLIRDISTLSTIDVGKPILTRARIHTSRLKGKQCFLVLRVKFATCQAVCSVQPEKISKQCLQFLAKVPRESVVDVYATVQATPFKVSGCSLQEIELHIKRVLVISRSDSILPMQVDDAMRPLAADQTLAHVNQDTRLDNRIIDLRTPANQAIYAIEAGIVRLFREQFDLYGFTEIFTPKIIGAASEGGANVFRVSYFKTDAFLAQSPQLYKQMAIAGDFERVYTIGAVFRAEESFTHRHLTEFTGVDCEMAFMYHYHEALQVYGKMFLGLLSAIERKYQKELQIISQQYPFEPFSRLFGRTDFLHRFGLLYATKHFDKRS
ncbi:hypothetical protein ACOME3_005256 [Neoechinorhynchus agilis]